MWKWLAGLVVLAALAGGAWFFIIGHGGSESKNRVSVALPPIGGGRVPALLLPAPDPGLVENTPDGPLPITSKDGRQAWQIYARPFDRNEKRPRLALVVTGLGLDRSLSQSAMDRLPGPVTLAFDPYAANLTDSLQQARNLGHETLLGLPMEPLDYPRQDPGPLTLLASAGDAQNMARFNKVLASGVGYVGLVSIWGERFTAEKSALLPILTSLKERGLMLVDNKPPTENATALLAAQMRLPWIAANRFIDSDTEPAAIDQALADLETGAKRDSVAVVVAALSPALLDRATTWITGLDSKGFVLAPASAVANRQAITAVTTP